ncbi:related to CAP20-virulence factor [Rhynchosporium agropyri]|uniref:Related to CAP20-virulence factor n=1 Tax=Rhynchosporium agropyri TaxID=914238 RepID=A0A1E1KHK6_9HELO|nr:related to CAP20-virulence factor [Rhynchosporium agropyri]
MATKQVNGEAPSSAFLSHLFSYPLIHDTLTTIQRNPYGARSISLTSSVTHSITQKVSPFIQTPLTYASPYLSRADTLGDSTLSTIDEKFPVVKKPTNELLDDGKAIVWFPYNKGNEGKEYVFGVWGGECKKVGGEEGVVKWGKAALATGIVVAGDSYNLLSGFLAAKKQEGKEGVNGVKEVVNEKANN